MKFRYFILYVLLCLLTFSLHAQQINRLEYFFDTDPGIGMGTLINIPSPDESVEYTFNADITGLLPGFHKLYVRVLSSSGKYSLQEGRSFYVLESALLEKSPPPLQSLDYFFDTDPGVGNGTTIPIAGYPDEIDDVFDIPATGLAEGFHKLYVRVKDSIGTWTLNEGRSFYVIGSSSITEPAEISAAEYFIDEEPGVGNGTPVSFFETGDTTEDLFMIPLPQNLVAGFHKLYVRTMDTDGKWSLSEGRPFYVNDTTQIASSALITKVEYFLGKDPGFGNGTLLDISPASSEIDFNFEVDITGRTPGSDTLYVRVINEDGEFSQLAVAHFIIQESNSVLYNSVAFNLYPNPASSKLIVKNININNKPVLYSIVDLQGRIITQSAMEPNEYNEFIIHIDHLTPGMYVLRMINPDDEKTDLKFIKE